MKAEDSEAGSRKPGRSRAAEHMATAKEAVGALVGVIDEVLNGLIAAGSKCALLDFPFHANVGDSAIWLGEKRWLALRNVTIVYEADMFSYREGAFRAIGDDAAVLITGGGSFGDVWPLAQAAREKVLSQLAGRRIIQMPQTVHFEKPENLTHARDVIAALKDFTLLCRDSRSLEVARESFACPSLLCPDMAFALGPQSPSDSEVDCVWLARTDKESAFASADIPSDVWREDWTAEQETELQSERWGLLRRLVGSETPDEEALKSFSHVNDVLAGARLSRGLALLSKGRGIVTDRLHGHILAMLLGRPHVLVDNTYGKNRTFYETWTRECDAVELVDPRESTPADILRALQRLTA